MQPDAAEGACADRGGELAGVKPLYEAYDLNAYQRDLMDRHYRWWTCGGHGGREGCDITVKLGPGPAGLHACALGLRLSEVHWMGRRGWHLRDAAQIVAIVLLVAFIGFVLYLEWLARA